MRDEPSGAALLDVAQKALMDEIAPALSGGQRYTALMVANAMRIVAREIELGPRAERARDDLLGQASEASSAGDRARQLVEAIRRGAFDANAGLHQALWESTAVAAGMWKPALLAEAETEATG